LFPYTTLFRSLGINYTCSLAIGLAMEQMFQATNEAVDQALRQVWTKSTEIAAISQALCRHFTRLQPDQATLAGLVHQIGVLPILAYVEERELTLVDAASLAHLIERLHPRLGERILRAWDFPEAIAMVPAQMGDFTRDSPSVDYVDVVQVAILQSHLGTGHPLTQLDWASVPALAKLGFDPKADIQSDEDVQGALRVAMSMLQYRSGLRGPPAFRVHVAVQNDAVAAAVLGPIEAGVGALEPVVPVLFRAQHGAAGGDRDTASRAGELLA